MEMERVLALVDAGRALNGLFGRCEEIQADMKQRALEIARQLEQFRESQSVARKLLYDLGGATATALEPILAHARQVEMAVTHVLLCAEENGFEAKKKPTKDDEIPW